MKGTPILKRFAIIIVMMAVTAATWAIQNKMKERILIRTGNTIKRVKNYDPLLVDKLKMLSASLNIKDKSCTYSGVLDVVDNADTNHSIKNLNFLVCKQQQNCYYKVGTNETLNVSGVYIYIDNDQRKVFVGAQKKLTTPDIASGVDFKKDMLDENYALSATNIGKLQTLSLLNEKHITCKQYDITYDTVALKVNRIYTRLANSYDPMNKKKEKILEVYFNSWEEQADINKYMAIGKVIIKAGNQLKLTDKYKKYELIRIQ